MTIYVPGTQETDLKKIIMSLQQTAARADADPTVFASLNGVNGDAATDSTAALQAIVDRLPVTGGQVFITGEVCITSLNLEGRRNIRFVGIGGQGGGAGFQRSHINVTAGAVGIGVPIINCRGTSNVSFQNLEIVATNTAMNGVLIEYGGGTGSPLPANAAHMVIEDCSLTTRHGSSVVLSIYGATDGHFGKVSFNGPGRHVQMQTVATVGFCNGNTFSTCSFVPSGTVYPIFGSGEGVSFVNCVFEPGSDSIGRGWQSSSVQPFKGISFSGCWFGDATVAGGEWILATWGNGLAVTGCSITGCAGSYGVSLGGGGGSDPQEAGCRGVSIMGNFFSDFAAGVNFYGTIAAKTNVRGAVIGGNSCTNAVLAAGYAGTAEQLVFLPNSIYGAPLQIGSHMAFVGLPAYANNAAAVAAGLVADQLYRVGNIVEII